MVDLDYRILRLYRSRRFDMCVALCGDTASPETSRLRYYTKMRAMTIQAKVAGFCYEETEYLAANDSLVDSGLAKTARPGTTFQRASTQNTKGLSEKRAATAGRAHTITARARTARTALATAARVARASTALHTAGADGPLALTVLNSHHLSSPLAKTIFEYVFFSEGEVRKAMEIVLQAQRQSETVDWWWNFAAAQCHLALGTRRSAEDCLRLALQQNQHLAVYLRLIAMYVALDQPQSAIQVCSSALAVFPEDTSLLVEQARIYDATGNQALALQEYRKVAIHDPNNTEAIANIAHYNFYNDQPEIALRYYRRMLATMPPNAELLNNLGLCCLSCHQLDAVGPCFRHALRLATAPDTKAELWFNLAHVALMTGDLRLAQRCLQVSVAVQSNFQPAVVTLFKLRGFLKKQQSDDATVDET